MSSFSTGVSRRNFMRILGAASAAATSYPALAAIQQGAAAAPVQGPGRKAFGADMGDMRHLNADTVIISSNENPLGPAQSALGAIATTAPLGGRYHMEETMQTVQVLYDQFNLKKGYIALTPGSGGPLDLALMSNIGPDKPLVYADPSYEQGPRAADTMKAPKFPVPLTATYAHDVRAMLKAHPSPGAYYIVNPNNPTGTMTPREDILWLLQNKPAGSVVIVDEAYFHFSDHESVLDQVAADKDIIVLRTFSKIYGMAGLRAGYAAGRPDLLAKFNTVAAPARSLASISITSSAAARASLLDKDLVSLRRKINSDVRAETLEFLTKKGYKIVPGSQANMFMVDVKRPGRAFQMQMMKENVAIGRTWAAMPNYVRVTVGTKDEMAKFETAFVKCMDQAPGTVNGAELHLPEHYVPSELHRA
ncbi:MAG: pyridoxal phosphate-dependent aminotransferase [Edaphobacter sp.]|uniref:pyridoxal phosphate-dependent aminotransferase n=1 Tax=Edaphobacter sp. TaxID=1934404 RepID=UPI0023A5B9AE|nr:pyridoxal phosphate-dependent aminotransferase [Edaphobacter sp.]MDE1177885.1 pyridoxal phosphate-dependent aminotransferase [Edaphobacter sp.]